MKPNTKKPLPAKDAAAAYDHFGEAIKHEIARYSVRVVTIKNEVPSDVGSGTCVKIGPRYFILTAAHVILGFPAEDLWIVAKGGAMNQRVRPTRIGMRGGKKGEALDVAYIELDSVAMKKLNLEALPMSRLHGRPILADEVIALSGVPSKTLSTKRRGPQVDDIDLIWQPFIAITVQTDSASWHPETDKSVEIEVEYPEHFAPLNPGSVPQDLPDAPGISGGGFWLCNLPKGDEVWSATKLELAGTITAWHRTHRYVTASRIANTLALLSDDFPEWRLVSQ